MDGLTELFALWYGGGAVMLLILMAVDFVRSERRQR